MQLSNLSPKAIQLLLFSFTCGALAVLFTIWILAEAERAPNTITFLAFGAFANSIVIWTALQPWKGIMCEYKYGAALAEFSPNSKLVQNAVVELEEHALASRLPTLKTREKADKLSYPWPSALTTFLFFAILSLIFEDKDGVSVHFLLAACIFTALVMRPTWRWCRFQEITPPFDVAKANQQSLLPLDKHFDRIDHSNFYRFHERCLLSLGFECIDESQNQHSFIRRGSSTIATIGRLRNDKTPNNFISFASIDDTGRVIKSHSIERVVKVLSDAHPMLLVQTVDAQNTIEALLCHQRFLETHYQPQCNLLDASRVRNAVEHLYELTARARIRYFNEKQVAFA